MSDNGKTFRPFSESDKKLLIKFLLCPYLQNCLYLFHYWVLLFLDSFKHEKVDCFAVELCVYCGMCLHALVRRALTTYLDHKFMFLYYANRKGHYNYRTPKKTVSLYQNKKQITKRENKIKNHDTNINIAELDSVLVPQKL